MANSNKMCFMSESSEFRTFWGQDEKIKANLFGHRKPIFFAGREELFSVTILGDLLDSGPLFKAFGNN